MSETQNDILIQMPIVWKPIIENIQEQKRPYILIPTGRVSGKTKNSVLVATLLMLQFPYTDIVVTRSSYGSISDSSYAEFETAIQEMPEEISDTRGSLNSPS